MERDTRILHAGYRPSDAPGPYQFGPQFSSTFTAPGDPARHELTYARMYNPTWGSFETAIAELEGGPAVCFSSGMAAVSAVLGVCLSPGDVVVLPSDSYYTVRNLATGWLAKLGIEARLVPTRGDEHSEALQGARLLWLETPSNPLLDVCDVRALAGAAREQGARVVVDNTLATGYLQQPLALGADFVVASDTKALCGHSDLILGHVAAADEADLQALRKWRTEHGAIAGPMEVWLAHRSIATLPLRVDRQCETAGALAEFLSHRPEVEAVHYPGLPDHPGHEVARRQMRGFGGVVSFDLGSRPRAEAFLGALTFAREATSFGGVHSSAERRARWAGDDVGDGFIRFSVGCEATQDVLEEVERGLRAAADG